MRHVQFVALGVVCGTLALHAAAQGPLTQRVSVSSNGSSANGPSYSGAIARDGNHVVFTSYASNLVAGDTNAAPDVFVHDLVRGITTRESVSSTAGQASAYSNSIRLGISADGRFVVFCSDSPSLVPGDTNAQDDVFLRDRVLGTTTRVSVASAGQQGTLPALDPSVSDDGRYVAFHSSAALVTPDANGTLPDVFVRDVIAGTTSLVSVNAQGVQADGASRYAFLSGNGRFVAFQTWALNMVPPGTSTAQVALRDLLFSTTTIQSVNSGGIAGDGVSSPASLSVDGRWLVFDSLATNLAPGDTLGLQDGFLRDRVAGNTFRVSEGYEGAESNGDGFVSGVSDDARYVSLGGRATNMLPFDDNGTALDCWVRDLSTADNIAGGADTNGQPTSSLALGLSGSGRVVLFSSQLDQIVLDDSNGVSDLFVRTAIPESAIYFCTAKINSLGCTPQIRSFGKSSAQQPSGFQITASSVRNRRPGMLMYCVGGRSALPFAGGTLCLAVVHRNTPILNAGGSAAPLSDCSGSYSLDMNAFAQGLLGGPPLPELSSPGSTVECQWWSRDPGFAPPNAIGLTGGIEYTVGS